VIQDSKHHISSAKSVTKGLVLSEMCHIFRKLMANASLESVNHVASL